MAHNPIYIGVDAFDESGDDLLSPGMVEIQFLPEVAPEFEKPRPDIALDRFLPQNLGDRPRCSAPAYLQLKKPVRGDIKALGKKEVVLVLGKDMSLLSSL